MSSCAMSLVLHLQVKPLEIVPQEERTVMHVSNRTTSGIKRYLVSFNDTVKASSQYCII